MITKTTVFQSNAVNPYENLALEEYLLFHTEPGECILYLWQNQHTVVIGKNQNSWKECDVSLLEAEGGYLARRLSGGGAVYHDLGNLNFTFLVRKGDYDLDKQLRVIQEAVKAFGIPAEKSGRNDLLVEGRKFSGNAFYESGDFSYHHGTILVDVNTERMSRYLTVSKEKLKSKGVDSVRSRVGNLTVFCPEITIEAMKKAMVKAFGEVYGIVPKWGELLGEEREAVNLLKEKYASWDWRYGKRIPFTHSVSGRFPWGGVELELKVDQGRIQDAILYSDALETRIFEITEVLQDCPYERNELKERILKGPLHLKPEIRQDLAELLWEKI